MAATKAQKQAYNDAIKDTKDKIAELKSQLKDLMLKKSKMKNIAGYYNLEMAVIHTQLLNLNLNMSDASVEILKTKNSSFLDSARKEFSGVLLRLEEVVGSDIDRPLSENKEYLKYIDKLTPKQTLEICRKISFSYDTLIDRAGDNSKWKWSFVDMKVRVANCIKNLINFSDLEKHRNFRSEFFHDREALIKLCKSTLEDAAKQARNKYELSTQAPEDIKKAVDLLTSLRNINILYGETEEASKNKTVIDALRARLEEEEKKNKKRKKKK